MENAPEKEPQIQPIFDDCSNCDKRYQLTAMNSAGRLYPKQPDCSYLLCVCPNCKYRTRIFCNETTLEMAALNGIEVYDDEPYAEPEIYTSWLDVKGIELPQTYELTDRHERLIGQFATTLANCPDGLLYDLITDDNQGRPHPQRWV